MKCSMCGAEAQRSYRPFCSKRCADLDLAKWLNGSYAIAYEGSVDEDERESEAEYIQGVALGSEPRH